MDNNPLISVIVPIYHVEKYLNRCVGSITDQTYRNLQIILVDDGSPDNCPQICDDWAQKDNRIEVLHVVNGGAGKARNIGIKHAVGEWTVLVDGDDYLHPNMIRRLFDMIDNGVDLSECCIVNTYSDEADFSEVTDKDEEMTCNAEEALGYLLDDRIFRQTPPNKLYKTSVIKTIHFPQGKLIDDEFWTYKVIGECNLVKHSSLKLYAYRQQEGSVMHRSYSVKRLQVLDAKYERLKYISERFPVLEAKAKINFLETCIYQGQMVEKYLDGQEKVDSIKLLKTYYLKVSVDKSDLTGIKISHRIWLFIAKLSLVTTCKIKNFFRIGI